MCPHRIQIFLSVFFSRIQKPVRERSPFALPLFLALSIASLPAYATGPPQDDGTLAVVGSEGAFLHAVGEPGNDPPTAIEGVAAPSAVVSDLDRGVLWIVGGTGVSAHDLDGTMLFSVPLEAPDPIETPAADIERHLVLNPFDGSVWAGADRHLWSVSSGGEVLAHVEFDDPLVDLALDPGRDGEPAELWTAGASAVIALDGISGDHLRSLELPAPREEEELESHEVTSLAVVERATDDETGAGSETESESEAETEVWVALGRRLLRYGPDGVLRMDEVLVTDTRVTSMISDGAEGAWLLAGFELAHYVASKDQVRIQTPFRPERPLTALAFDAGRSAVWVAGGDELVRVGLSGWALGRKETVGVPVSDVAVVASTADETPPQIEIVEPAAGEVVAELRPEIRVSYTDAESGVLAGSLRLSVNGSEIASSCSYSTSEAICRPHEDLPEGEVRAEAEVRDAVGNRSDPATQTFTVDSTAETSETTATEEGYSPVASPRGFRPDQPFVFGEVDAIDTASGNVTLRVPLGQVYEVGPKIRYQFQVVNNSNAWDHFPVDCEKTPDCTNPKDVQPTFSVPNMSSNAGLGWELHFGKLYSPIPPTGLSGLQAERWPNKNLDPSDLAKRWLYVAPDGARHTLHVLENRTTTNAANGIVRYSKDGTFLRLNQQDGNTMHLEFPDGRISVFERTGDTAVGTDFCGSGVSGCWRFDRMVDPYENEMWVTYKPDGTQETWTVSDSTGRSHTITFDTGNLETAGGDGPTGWSTPDGDEWGDLRRVVKKVELAAFQSGETNDTGIASYEFTYAEHQIGRSCPHDTAELPVSVHTIDTMVLQEIAIPHSPSWTFTTDTSSATGCGGGDSRGRITGVTLPTQGRIEYSYVGWQFPTRCDFENGTNTAETTTSKAGIHKKTRKKIDGTVEGVWTYQNQLLEGPDGLDGGGADCRRHHYRETTVNGPRNTDDKFVRTVTYHSTFEGPKDSYGTESGTDWQVTDTGLPFTKTCPAGVTCSVGGADLGKLYLSSQTFLCDPDDETDTTSCTHARSVYRRYVSEFRTCSRAKGAGDSAECYQVNPMQLAERTVYEDDGDKYVERRSSDFDGAGHFRVVTTTDDFDGTTSRSTTTSYDATGDTSLAIGASTGYVNPVASSGDEPSDYLPAPSASWILTPYTKITRVGDGRTYVAETEFDKHGSLVCRRTWKGETARSADDRLVKLTLGESLGKDAGLPVTEEVAGGEEGELATGDADVCTVDPSKTGGRYYRFDHTYADLQLTSTRIGTFPYRYEAEIDENTGLPSKVFNPSGQAETLTFDDLGRLTKIQPETSRKEAATIYTYSNEPAETPGMRVQRKHGVTTLTSETTVFDGFGRPISHLREKPPEDGTEVLTDQKTVYDAAGHVVTETTRQLNGSVSLTKAWRHSDFDAFGRARQTVQPDGWTITRTFSGDRQDTTKVTVETDSGREVVTTTTTRDALGRTVSVAAPEHTTTFAYDPNGRQVKATRTNTDGTVSQERLYTYDARGDLLAAKLPEVTGNEGKITYEPDALGLSRTTHDGLHELTWTYDGNGRPTQVADSGGRVWKEWTYGDENLDEDEDKVFDNYRLGRLVEAVRYNHSPDVPSEEWEDVAIIERYAYREGTAGPSEMDRQVWWFEESDNTQWGATFRTSFGYDPLGNRDALTYPACVENPTTQGGARPCADGNDQPATGHTAEWTYTTGLMTRAESTSLGLSADFVYHKNLQLSRASYSNGVLGKYAKDPNNMMRPRRRSFEHDSSTLFDTGNYVYDGAGNIHEIGDDVYTYDGSGRLTSGTVKQAGNSRIEKYSYDALDNVTKIDLETFDRTLTVDQATNRVDHTSDVPSSGDWVYL